MSAKEITRIATFGAILYLVYFAGSFIEYIELVSFLILVYGTTLKTKIAYFSTVVFSCVVMLMYGFSPWTIMYLVVFPQYILIYSAIAKRTKNRIIHLIVAGILSFCLGTLIEIPSIFMFGYYKHGLIPYLIAGFIVSAGNMACTLVAGLFLYDPISNLIRRIAKDMVK